MTKMKTETDKQIATRASDDPNDDRPGMYVTVSTHDLSNMKYKIVERKNHNALHGIFESLGSAERHLTFTIPEYCAKGCFMDKTLKPEDFEIVPYTKKD